jgi:predicted DsbA family dithiol-disulfide isomerase
VIEVFADVWCPFAHVGLRAVVARRRELGRDDVALRIRAWPLEFVNGQPLDRHEVAEEIADLRAQVAGDLFAGFDERAFPHTSLPALALASAAYRRSDRTGEAVSFALRNALFEEGRDIGDPGVVASIAAAYDLDAVGPDDDAAVLADWHEGQRRDVKGSPHFFCGAINAFCPALVIAKDENHHLRVRVNPHGLDDFMTRCLSTGT